MEENKIGQAPDINLINEKIQSESVFIENLRIEVGKTIIGQREMIDALIIGLLCDGHILLEGMPGLAKTLAVNTLASAISAKFHRIQFTPDLLPADLIGTEIYSPKKEEFYTKKGPIFANFILADEINRAPAKVQSALLEAMQERQVTIGEETFKLEDPFLVLATQNPIEQEGTYPLPEAQLDRFLFKIQLSYPSEKEETQIVRQHLAGEKKKAVKVLKPKKIKELREVARMVYMDAKIEKYIIDLVFASRDPKKAGIPKIQNLIAFGGSPRASINLGVAAKAYAFLKRRGYVIPEDIRAVFASVMRHRIGLTYEAEAEGISPDEVVKEIMNSVEIP